jgi:hypothetical protein
VDTDHEAVIWYSTSNDRFSRLRQDAWLIGIAVFLTLIAACAAANSDATGGLATTLVVATLIPIAAAAVAIAWVRDQRALVQITLTAAGPGSMLHLRHLDGRVGQHPAAELTLVEIVHTTATTDYATMHLHLGGRVLRTLPGPATLPDRWVENLTDAGVRVRTRTRIRD